MPSTNIDTDQHRSGPIPHHDLEGRSRAGTVRRLALRRRGQAATGLHPQQAGSRRLPDPGPAGRNIGCGSSREHAPWALVDYGFQAVISTEIADIFRNNSLKNGLLPVVVDDATHAWLIANPGAEVQIDLANASVQVPGRAPVTFPIDPFARYCLINGVDELGFLLSRDAEIKAYEGVASHEGPDRDTGWRWHRSRSRRRGGARARGSGQPLRS
jgi:3-isopropylmalate dehydratase small subunit